MERHNVPRTLPFIITTTNNNNFHGCRFLLFYLKWKMKIIFFLGNLIIILFLLLFNYYEKFDGFQFLLFASTHSYSWLHPTNDAISNFFFPSLIFPLNTLISFNCTSSLPAGAFFPFNFRPHFLLSSLYMVRSPFHCFLISLFSMLWISLSVNFPMQCCAVSFVLDLLFDYFRGFHLS